MFVITDRFALLFFSIVLVAVIVLVLIKHKDLKKRLMTILYVGLALAVVASIVCAHRLYMANKVIGTFEGGNFATIVIDGVTYDLDYDNSYSSSDTKKLLGKVVSKKNTEGAQFDTMYVWSIDDTDEYIYAVCVYDGAVYRIAEAE